MFDRQFIGADAAAVSDVMTVSAFSIYRWSIQRLVILGEIIMIGPYQQAQERGWVVGVLRQV